jgi:hypothetical protein
MIYIIILLFLLLFSIHYDVNNYRVSNTLIFFWWLIFVLLAGLRYRVGGDTISYMIYYEKVPDLKHLNFNYLISNEYQPLWIILCSLCKSITKGFTFFQIIHAIILNSVIFYFIRKNTSYFFTGILFYFIFYYLYFNTEILREALAVSVFLLSLKYFFSEKWLMYYILCFVAFMLHLSAVILFFLPLFKTIWTNRSYIILSVILLTLFILFKNYISNNLINYIPYEAIRIKATNLMGALGAKANLNGIIYTSVVYIIIPLVLIYISEQFVGYKSRFRPFLIAYITISLVSIFLSPVYRFLNYITPIYYLFLANMLHELFRYSRVRRFRYTIVLIVFLLPFSVHLLTIGKNTSDKVPGTRFYSRYTPYYSVLNKKIDKKREQLVKIYLQEGKLIYVKKKQ